MGWTVENLGLIWELSLEHIRQSVIPIVLGFALSLPLGWLAARFRGTRGVVLTVTGLLYTIPSFALFALLPPLLGISYLSELNLTIALTVYAVALMVRSVVDGLASVDESTRLAATAMGYGSFRRFWAVEIPLAGPVILAGLRVTAVSTISLATVGILIGVTNLGYLFTNGYQRRIVEEIFAGVVTVMIIALAFDALLLILGRVLMPWTNSEGSGAARGRRRTRIALETGARA